MPREKCSGSPAGTRGETIKAAAVEQRSVRASQMSCVWLPLDRGGRSRRKGAAGFFRQATPTGPRMTHVHVQSSECTTPGGTAHQQA